MGFCNCGVFCCVILYVHSSFAIILMVQRGLVSLLMSGYRCVAFLAVPWVCLQFVIVVLSDRTYYFGIH